MKYLYIIILGLFSFYSFSQCGNDTLDIGSDTILCSGESIHLNAGPGYLIYDWSTGSTASAINVNSQGVYYCNAQVIDSLNIVLNGDFTYGDLFFTSNYIYGTGGSWGLLSLEGQYAISTNANLTHTNFVNCTDHTTGTGNYMIINGSSTANQHIWCQTIGVTPNTDYIFSAWFTSVTGSNPAILDFTIDGVAIGNPVNLSSTTCMWQNFFSTWTSNATQTSATICITNQNTQRSGNDFGIDDIYFAQVCSFHDTVIVDYADYPNVDLGNDTIICENDSLIFNAKADSLSTYLWSDDSIDSIYISDTTETIWVIVSNAHCSDTDTVMITSNTYPQFDLGNDTIICNGSSIDFDISWPNSTYLWSDNSTSANKTISNSGLYWAEVNNNNCISRDSVDIAISNGPSPGLNPKTIFCEGESVKLNCGNFYQYLWSTGQTTAEIWLNENDTGLVNVIVWDSLGCYDSAQTEVFSIKYPNITLDISDDTICLGNNLVITASGADSYLWNNLVSSAVLDIIPESSNNYNLTAINSLDGVDCEIDTSVFIFAKDCNTMYVPNAFSPDNDGLNDYFGPQGEFLLEEYKFFIYDRWGKLVFSTEDINEYWDGKNKEGEDLPPSVYIYLIRIKEPFINSSEYYGTVHLIR